MSVVEQGLWALGKVENTIMYGMLIEIDELVILRFTCQMDGTFNGMIGVGGI